MLYDLREKEAPMVCHTDGRVRYSGSNFCTPSLFSCMPNLFAFLVSGDIIYPIGNTLHWFLGQIEKDGGRT